MRWRVGGTRPPSVPMSCELPHMKGRNWKSSRPHTPWLPAGSILYVFWSFRITSRYLHGREGKRGRERKKDSASTLPCRWAHKAAGNRHSERTGLHRCKPACAGCDRPARSEQRSCTCFFHVQPSLGSGKGQNTTWERGLVPPTADDVRPVAGASAS